MPTVPECPNVGNLKCRLDLEVTVSDLTGKLTTPPTPRPPSWTWWGHPGGEEKGVTRKGKGMIERGG